MKADESILTEIRRAFSEECERLFSVKCNTNDIIIGGNFSDVTLRISFTHGVCAEACAETLMKNRESFVFRGKRIIKSASVTGRYINIILEEELLEWLADEVIRTFPQPLRIRDISAYYEYAVARAHMMSNKSTDFKKSISDKHMRKAFFDALLLADGGSAGCAAKSFIEADEKLSLYDGMGKTADCICRLLYSRYQ